MQMLTLFIHKEFKNSLHLRSNSNCCNQSNCHLSALLMIHRCRTSRLTSTTNSLTSYKTNWSKQTISFSKLAKIIFLPTTIGAQIKFRPSLKTISMKPNSMRRAQNISSGNLWVMIERTVLITAHHYLLSSIKNKFMNRKDQFLWKTLPETNNFSSKLCLHLKRHLYKTSLITRVV